MALDYMYSIESSTTSGFAGILFTITDYDQTEIYPFYVGVYVEVDVDAAVSMFFQDGSSDDDDDAFIFSDTLSFYNLSDYYSLKIEFDEDGIFEIELNGEQYLGSMDVSGSLPFNYYVQSVSIQNYKLSTISKSLFINGAKRIFVTDAPTTASPTNSKSPTNTPTVSPITEGMVDDDDDDDGDDIDADKTERENGNDGGTDVGAIVGVIIALFVLAVIGTLIYVKHSKNAAAVSGDDKKEDHDEHIDLSLNALALNQRGDAPQNEMNEGLDEGVMNGANPNQTDALRGPKPLKPVPNPPQAGPLLDVASDDEDVPYSPADSMYAPPENTDAANQEMEDMQLEVASMSEPRSLSDFEQNLVDVNVGGDMIMDDIVNDMQTQQ